jgi:hypothetical protein
VQNALLELKGTLHEEAAMHIVLYVVDARNIFSRNCCTAWIKAFYFLGDGNH